MISINLITPAIEARLSKSGPIPATCKHALGGVECESCRGERLRARARVNQTKLRHADPERSRARQRAYYQANIEKCRAQAQARREKDIEKERARQRDVKARARLADPQKFRDISAANRAKAVPGSAKAYAVEYRKRPGQFEKAKRVSREWMEANRDRARLRSRRWRGIQDAHLCSDVTAYQNGVCAICGDPPSTKTLHADHNHTDGTLRGMLCSRCNTGLGQFKDSPERLRSAIAYLECPPANIVRAHKKQA